jgi:ubiquitin carboxyl-terminal hydrolase 47
LSLCSLFPSYLNGLLQTLFMTPEFRRAIFTWNYDKNKDGAEEWCIPLQLQRLFGLLQLSTQRAVDTVALTRSFGWEGAEVFQQQDVQELTRVLFDALEDTFKGTPVENIIDELYAGEMVDYLRCLDVDYESERVDKFLDFSVAIVPFGSSTPMRSLTQCIELFLRPEILTGDNKYYAETFDRKVDAIKGLKFGRLPQILSVQLKRFVYDFSGSEIVQKKLNDVVKFPMVSLLLCLSLGR